MIATFSFELPWAGLLAVPLIVLLLLLAWRERGRGLPPARILVLSLVRLAVIVAVVALIARPSWISPQPPAASSREVVVLLDKSESMSFQSGKSTRFDEARNYLWNQLVPGFNKQGFAVRAVLFDAETSPADAAAISEAVASGRRTDLGRALAESVHLFGGHPPRAVVALTDGAANESSENHRGLTALTGAGIPFIGIGFGQDQGESTLNLSRVDAPPSVSTRTSFTIAARLEGRLHGQVGPFDLLLYRDERLLERKTVATVEGARAWMENFKLQENQAGVHRYSVQIIPPADTRVANTRADVSVRIADSGELRVLYVQGALTWDYKFVTLALRKDPTIRVTGLTRTSGQSTFRQNVESAGELLGGFPETLEQLAPFRMVVLSNLRPADLTSAQQDLLARYCGDFGGGVLIIGGPESFDASWRGTRLESMLPVVFSESADAPAEVERRFRFQPTTAALEESVFQIAGDRPAAEAWARLPQFDHYAQVDAPKPGARVWAVHETAEGPHGKRILMACQRYGAGLSAVLTVQSLWRWRLAKDGDPEQFDRFWRQLFRHLSDVGRQEVAIHFADQETRPGKDLRVLLEKQPRPGNVLERTNRYLVRVEDRHQKLLAERVMALSPLAPEEFRFRVPAAGFYSVAVADAHNVPVANRSIEVRDGNPELKVTGRSMTTLQQWAAGTGGAAYKVEECPDVSKLLPGLTREEEETAVQAMAVHPLGLNGWTLAVLLGCLGTEWALRRRWGLI